MVEKNVEVGLEDTRVVAGGGGSRYKIDVVNCKETIERRRM